MSETLIEKFNRVKTEIENQRNVMNGMLKDVFAELSQEYFLKYPTTVSFAWNQYTPYFNDGEPCTFDVHRDISMWSTIDVEGKDHPDDYNEYDFPDGYNEDEPEKSTVFYYGYVWGDSKITESHKAAQSFLGMFEDEDLEQMFGDGYKITVNKDGVSVEEYEHD